MPQADSPDSPAPAPAVHEDPDWLPPEINTGVAHSARVYNYWLGGKDNFAADRVLGDAIIKAVPSTVFGARANRAFLGRAVRYLATEAGIRQFLDIGTGIPAADNTHEVAQAAAPDSGVLYVDNDPIVLAHARALMTSHPVGSTAFIRADLRDPDKILNDPTLRYPGPGPTGRPHADRGPALRDGRRQPTGGRFHAPGCAALGRLPRDHTPYGRLRQPGRSGGGRGGGEGRRRHVRSAQPGRGHGVLLWPGPGGPGRGAASDLATGRRRTGKPARCASLPRQPQALIATGAPPVRATPRHAPYSPLAGRNTEEVSGLCLLSEGEGDNSMQETSGRSKVRERGARGLRDMVKAVPNPNLQKM